jgi:hypothetical protein
MRKFAACLIAAWVVIGGVLIAQPPAPKPKVAAEDEPGFRSLEVPIAAGVARQTVDVPAEGVCRVTFCTDDLRRILIHDAKGSLVINARSVDLKIARIGELPIVTCKIYDGIFEPTGAPTKTWKLAEMRFVEAADFQKLVDQGTIAQRSDVPIGTTPSGAPAVNLQNVTPLIPDEAPAVPPAAPAAPANPSRPGAP